MSSLIATVLQLVVAILTSLHGNPSIPMSMQQEAITAASQAIQLATQATQARPAAAIAGWDTYQNKSSGFSFQYPSGDSVFESTSTSNVYDAGVYGVYNDNGLLPYPLPASDTRLMALIRLPSPDYMANASDPINIALSVWRTVEVWRDNSGQAASDCAAAKLPSSSAMLASENPTAVLSATTSVGGLPALLFEWDANPGAEMLTSADYGVGYAMLRAGACWQIEYTSSQSPPDGFATTTVGDLPISALDADESANLAFYLQILRSFTFTGDSE